MSFYYGRHKGCCFSVEESLATISGCAFSTLEKYRLRGGNAMEIYRVIRNEIDKLVDNVSKSSSSGATEANKTGESSVVDPMKEEMKRAVRQSSAQTSTGPTLGELFIIGHKLGEGGFATVYSAVRRSDQELVALKRILLEEVPNWVQESDGNKHPLEVDVTNKVNSIEGVPALLDVFVTSSICVLVLEQPPPPVQNLEDYIQGRSCDISEDELWDILRQVTKIVADVHAAGVSHRDIRTENILIEIKTGRVYLIDFGCGVTLETSDKESKLSGSWFNRSKRMYACAQRKAERSNVYSIGLLAYRIMTGERPLLLRSKDKVSISFPEHFSPDLKNFLLECLAKEPSKQTTIRKLSNSAWLTPRSSLKRTKRVYHLPLPINRQMTICQMCGIFKIWVKLKCSSQPPPRPTFFIGAVEEVEESSEQVKSKTSPLDISIRYKK